MKVKIVKCTNPGFWYAGLVGQTFDVEPSAKVDTDCVKKYTVVPTPGTCALFLINVDDCQLESTITIAQIISGSALISVLNKLSDQLDKLSCKQPS